METPPALLHEVWKRTPPEAQAYILALEARVETLTSMVRALQEQVGTLQEQLNQTARNASRPPSSDPPQVQRPRRLRGKRRRGGPPGHPGHTRTLLPVEAVDAVVVLKPEACTQCHAPFLPPQPGTSRTTLSSVTLLHRRGRSAMLHAIAYRLYPSKSQQRGLETTLETCRCWYNTCLSERQRAYEQDGRTVGKYEQLRQVKTYKATNPYAVSVHSHVLQTVVSDLDRAFQAFFRRVKAGEEPGLYKPLKQDIMFQG